MQPADKLYDADSIIQSAAEILEFTQVLNTIKILQKAKT